MCSPSIVDRFRGTNGTSLLANVVTTPIVRVLHEDKFTARAFNKPRGYAGDAVLLDYIYGAEQFWSPPEMSWIGQRIHRWTTISSACEGVKARRGMIAETIDRLADEMGMPHVLSLAAGHLREAELSSAIMRRRLGRLVAIDSDRESLKTIEADYNRYGVETIWASARELMQGKFDLGTFDLIYTSGLYDYLNDTICRRLTSTLFNQLNPGGRLIMTNFLEEIEGVGYMEAIMDWNLIYRNRLQLMQLTERIPEREIARISTFSEENHNVVFMTVERA